MERTLWILSHFSSRLAVLVLGFCDYYIYQFLHKNGVIDYLLENHKILIIIVVILVILACILSGIRGGLLGYKYVEMGRSRRWHYRANEYQRKDDHLNNTLYWAGKFACFPLIVVLFIFFILGIVYII